MVSAEQRCECGSGLPFARCHGNPANDFAREQALREAESVPFLFPFVRARSERLERFADRAARALHGDDDTSPRVLEQGVAILDSSERRRAIDAWAVPYRDRWYSIVHTSADAAAAEAALVRGAVAVAIAERQPPPTEWLEPVEEGRLDRSRLAALATVLAPQFVWSIAEQRAAEAAAGAVRKRQRLDVIEQAGYALVTYDHIRRTRSLARRLARSLPRAGVPNASRLLVDVCGDVERDVDAARAATVALLLAYVEERAAAAAAASG